MLAQVGLAVACSVAAFVFTQFVSKREHLSDASEREYKKQRDEDHHKEVYEYEGLDSAPKEEEVEEVKRVNTISRTGSSVSLVSLSSQDADQLLLPEFKDLIHVDFGLDVKSTDKVVRSKGRDFRKFEDGSADFSDGILEIPEEILLLHSRNSEAGSLEPDVVPHSLDYDFRDYVDNLASDAEELGQLRIAVKELREREMKLEGELLEYYGLKEREKDIAVMEQNLRNSTAEVAKLTAKVSSMEAKEKKMSAELGGLEKFKIELSEARSKIRELQKKAHTESSQAKAELLMLKQQLANKQVVEQDKEKKDLESEKKLQILKELEVEVVELRRTNKEVSHQKRELVVKLGSLESQMASLSQLTENDLILKAQEDIAALRHANEDLFKQVEGLQTNRFSEVEEVVYLRWVNACLRYELRNFKAPSGKPTALDLNKNSSPRSQNLAKQLMLEYAAPDMQALRHRENTDSGYESASSEPSTTSEQTDLQDSQVEYLVGRSGGKRSGIMRKLKKWGSRHSDSGDLTSPSSGRSSPGHYRQGSSGNLKGSLEFMVRPNSDAHEITTYGTKDSLASPDAQSSRLSDVSTESNSDGKRPELLTSKANLKPIRTREKPAAGVASSFQLMSKSVLSIDEKYPAFKDRHKLAMEREKALKEKAEEVAASKRTEMVKMTPGELEKRALRVSKPPPKPSTGKSLSNSTSATVAGGGGPPPAPPPPPPPRPPGVPGVPMPPPPPPPPGSKAAGPGGSKMQRAPEVVEFYQSLMKRDAKKDIAAGGSGNSADVRNNMIGEIENRSTHLLAIKADVETQGEFVQSLAAEVRAAQYNDIEDVVAFVSWLDDELSFLVDERAVLKHFDWPEGKADAFREAAFEYQDLKKLQRELSSYEDDLRQPCDTAFKKMLSALEKVEQSVYALLRTRDMVIARYKEFSIPTNWMLDTGVVGKIKAGTVGLAKLYMKRVSSELDNLGSGSEKEPIREFLLLQGVRFAFRVHQFAGGFDPESMQAFEELRNRAHRRAVAEPIEVQ